MHILDKLKIKLDDKSLNCILLGYDEHSKAYKLYHMPTKIAKIIKDVVFNEGIQLIHPNDHVNPFGPIF